MMLFFTGFTRSAEFDRAAQDRQLPRSHRRAARHLRDGQRGRAHSARHSRARLPSSATCCTRPGCTKRKLDDSVSNPFIDEQYEAARKAGALGGKLLGAGGGGFLLMFVPPDRQPAVMDAMRGLSLRAAVHGARRDLGRALQPRADVQLPARHGQGFVSRWTANACTTTQHLPEPATRRRTSAASSAARTTACGSASSAPSTTAMASCS